MLTRLHNPAKHVDAKEQWQSLVHVAPHAGGWIVKSISMGQARVIDVRMNERNFQLSHFRMSHSNLMLLALSDD